MTNDAPLFVVGHERSGTTLLEHMLRRHPRIDIPPESAYLSFLKRRARRGLLVDDPARLRAVVEDLVDHRFVSEYWIEEQGFDREEIVRRGVAGGPSPGGIMAAILSLWAERSGAVRWGEKAPRNYLHLETLDAWFPDCQVLHIVRDPRDVAVSMLTPPVSERHPHGNEFEVALRWRDAIRRGRRAAGRLGPGRYVELRYEDLTADPERVLRDVCAFLREDFEPGMLEFHEDARSKLPASARDIHPRLSSRVDRTRVGRWRTEADEAFVLGIEGVAGAEMDAYGYERSGGVAPFALRCRIVLERLRPRRLGRRYKPARSRRRAAAAGA